MLRSSALNTGQNIVRAVLGTTIGLVIGGGIVALVGTNTALLWVLLPFAVLFAGLAPATISFAAGQAAFTLTLMILFNLLAPAGWQIGLVRIEDIASAERSASWSGSCCGRAARASRWDGRCRPPTPTAWLPHRRGRLRAGPL